MRKPDFFVVGAAKSGTSALWKYFQKHPEIFVTKDIASKELGYYSNQYGVSDEDYYLNFFKDAKPNQLIGEVCHAYLTSEESAQLIKNDIPKAKIIILLRNPIDRAYSLYNWMVMHGYENKTSFEKALNRESKLALDKSKENSLLHGYKQNYYYFNSGLYYNQVKKYYDIFNKDNVLVIEYGDFKKEQKKHLKDIFIFLGVETNINFKQINTNKSKRVISVFVQNLSRKLLLSKYSKFRWLKIISNLFVKINTIESQPNLVKNKTRIQLYEKYKEDISKLTGLVNINFDEKWYQE